MSINKGIVICNYCSFALNSITSWQGLRRLSRRWPRFLFKHEIDKLPICIEPNFIHIACKLKPTADCLLKVNGIVTN